MGALRFTNCVRPSIIGRDNFYNRYGEKEREAVASFDFLEELSTTSLSTASEPSDNASCSSAARPFSRTHNSRTSRTASVCPGDCDSYCDGCSCSDWASKKAALVWFCMPRVHFFFAPTELIGSFRPNGTNQS